MNGIKQFLMIACICCAACGLVLVGCGGGEEPPVHEHTVAEWVEETAPTCTEEGVEGGLCSGCNEWVTRAIPTIAHTFEQEEVLVAPECFAEGSALMKCIVCGKEETQSLPAAHDWKTLNVLTVADCETEGSREVECKVCGTKDTVSTPALGHSYGENGSVVTDATCTAKGVMKKTCTRCGKEGEVEIPALGHDWEGEYTVDAMPTADTEGSRSIHCTRCDAKKEVTALPKLSGDSMYLYEIRVLIKSSGNLLESAGIGFSVFDGDKEVASGTFRKGVATVPLAPKTYTLRITSCPKGYIAEDSYTLTAETIEGSGNIVNELSFSASLITGETPPPNTAYAEGSVMYDFTLTTLKTNARESETITLSGLLKEYKAVILNFWYVNCQFCNYEFPGMEAAYKDFKDDVAIIAINPARQGDTDEQVRSYANSRGLTFYVARDGAGLADMFNVTAFPTTVVIDPDGVAAEVHETALVNPSNYGDLAYCTAQFKEIFGRYASAPAAPAALTAPLPYKKDN